MNYCLFTAELQIINLMPSLDFKMLKVMSPWFVVILWNFWNGFPDNFFFFCMQVFKFKFNVTVMWVVQLHVWNLKDCVKKWNSESWCDYSCRTLKDKGLEFNQILIDSQIHCGGVGKENCKNSVFVQILQLDCVW